MQTIQIVLDQELLQAADLAARQNQVNRSALVREALRCYLRQLRIREAEQRDRAGYERIPDTTDDLEAWEREAAWPED